MTRVSRLLSQYGLIDGAWWTPEARARGQAVHDIAECLLTGVRVTCAPEFDGYRTAMVDAFRVLGYVPVRVEHRLTLAAFGLTGRPDSIGYLPKAVGKIPAGGCIIDLKSGEVEPAHQIQLALYTMLADGDAATCDLLPAEFKSAPWSRIGIYVRRTGRYKLEYYSDMADLAAAEALVTITNWRLTHGLAPESTVGIPTDDPTLDA